MSVAYHDYYKTLGVKRDASQDDIRKAYRKLARKYHPDVNKESGAEKRFKEIAEAYEVLGDPEKRRKYDELGSEWQAGQDFRPPPDWEGAHYEFSGGRPGGFSFEDLGGASDFFETLFGGGRSGGRREWSMRGRDQEADLAISLDEAFHGARKSVMLQTAELDRDGRVERKTRRYDVTIPPGTESGSRIRLAGQGGSGMGKGSAGDLILNVTIRPHPRFRPSGRDLEADLPVSPWEAALGARVPLPTMTGTVTLTVPAGTQCGQKLRLRGHGFPRRGKKPAGDLYAVIRIRVPSRPTSREKALFKELSEASDFNPRK